MSDFKIYSKQFIKIIITFLKGNYIYIHKKIKIDLDKNKKYAFIFFAADYDNLGDIAITLAQEKFLKECLGKNYQIIKITESEAYSAVKVIKKLDKEEVLITLIGGGNNGSLYEFIEAPRRFVLWKLKDYKIVSFPQTVTFENNVKATLYEKVFAKLCNRCSDLLLVAREKESYMKYKDIQKNRVLLTPDIVFSLDNNKNTLRKSNDVAFIMRDDKEKAIDLKKQEQLLALTKQKDRNIYFWDTCNIKYKENAEYDLLEDFIVKLRKVKFAVTDRLHGMILCYITRTPCIVIENNNGKIQSTYETWLADQNFICLYDHKERVEKYIQLMEYMESLEDVYAKNLNDEFGLLKSALEETSYEKSSIN